MKHFKQKTIALFLGTQLLALAVCPAKAADSQACGRFACANPAPALTECCENFCSPCGWLFRNCCIPQPWSCSGNEESTQPAEPSAPAEEDSTGVTAEIISQPAEEKAEVPAENETVTESETASVPAAETVTSAALEVERKVVELVNEQRAAYGLSPVALDEALCVKARVKSQDMADNHYFSHNSPTYGTPFEMMTALGVTYRTAGENIAMGYATAEAVVNAWMNSEGHRANILNASYQTLGVGYVADGNYWTQWFIG